MVCLLQRDKQYCFVVKFTANCCSLRQKEEIFPMEPANSQSNAQLLYHQDEYGSQASEVRSRIPWKAIVFDFVAPIVHKHR